MKTKEELNALKEEAETMNRKLAELTGEEIAQVSGGTSIGHISCSNPNCAYYRSISIVGCGAKCVLCGWDMVWIDEGFELPEE